MDWKKQYFEELYHHGIKGQKHGDRRFQYKDGSWTPLGRLRYGKSTREAFEDKMDPLYEAQLKSKRAVEDAGDEYEKYTTRSGKKGKRTVIPGKEAEAAAAKDKLDAANAEHTKNKRAVEDAEVELKKLRKEEESARQDLKEYKDTLNTQRTATNNIVTGTKSTTQGLSNIVDITNRARNQKARANSDAHTLSDAELERAIKRMNMERNYNSLKYDGQTSRGAENAKNALETIGSIVTVIGGVAGIALAIKELRNS